MNRYVAFLRGINVGGRTIKMEDLRKTFESLGFQNVKTILASGNVLFETSEVDTSSLTKTIEAKLKEKFGHDVKIILRTIEEIQDLVDSDPFKTITVTPDTRLYVTFLSEKPENSLHTPYKSPEGDFKILHVTDSEVCSVLTLSPNRGTTDVMAILEKEFGKKITTRNWNTINKINNA